MTGDEKKQYELARLGIARLMGDAPEIDKWAKVVGQTRSAEQRNGAELSDTQEASTSGCICWDTDSDDSQYCVCPVHPLLS